MTRGWRYGLRIDSNCGFHDITGKESINDDLDANTRWNQGPRPIERLV